MRSVTLPGRRAGLFDPGNSHRQFARGFRRIHGDRRAARGKIDTVYAIWLIRGGGRNILFDSGFHRERWFKLWTIKDYIRPDEAVRLGRMTVWEKQEGYPYPVPFGQKMWLVDEEEVPLLELRTLEFNTASVAA